MSGDYPLKGLRSFLALFLVCSGFLALADSLRPAHAGEADSQQTDMIPQDDIIVHNEGTTTPVPVTYSVRIEKEPDRIKLKGNVASEDDHKTLIGLVKANFPAVDLSDRITIEKKSEEGDVKLGGLSFALRLLGYVEEGHAAVDNNGLKLSGSADTAVVLTKVNQLIKKDKPTGVPIKTIHISVPKKSWHASINSENVVRITGVVSSQKSRKRLFETVRERFPNLEIVDETVINEKVDTNWAEVASKCLDMLSQLDQGSVEVTDEAIYLKGMAPSSRALDRIVAIGKDLPSGFSLKSEVTTPAPTQAGVAAIPSYRDVVPQ